MKKLVAFMLALVLALLLGASALAEVGAQLQVANCKEYVTLREEADKSSAGLMKLPLGTRVDELGPAENGFTRVAYRGQTGYVLSQYLITAQSYRGPSVDLTRDQRYNINLFLSNFTEQSFLWRGGCYDAEWVDPAILTRFAIDHCWFNRQNRLEWGDYFNYNNVRLPEDQIAPIVKKYFGVSITPSHNPPYIDYKNGYYYWEETGGHTSDGFACQYMVENYGGGRYCVRFGVFGGGSDWSNDACYDTWKEAVSAFPTYSYPALGFAIIDVGSSGLNDRSDWHVVRYAINFD